MRPSGDPTELPDLFAAERGHLLALLGGLGPGDWEQPTPCPGWTVLDLCRHLAGAGRLAVTAEQAWRLLSNNLPAEAQRHLDLSGDPDVVDVRRRTRAIIGRPK